jgi:hypothetical protein
MENHAGLFFCYAIQILSERLEQTVDTVQTWPQAHEHQFNSLVVTNKMLSKLLKTFIAHQNTENVAMPSYASLESCVKVLWRLAIPAKVNQTTSTAQFAKQSGILFLEAHL